MMIYGIGIDLVSIARIQRLCERHPERVWQRLCGGAKPEVVHAPRVAKIFAVKEAFAKATGLGFRFPVRLSSLRLDHDIHGRPFVTVLGDLAVWIASHGLSAHVSISDDEHYAIAQVILSHSDGH